MTLLAAPNWVPQSDADKEAVSRQLERLFAHHTFKSSRRCPAFLQYIVEHQLRGETLHLKERIIGAEVFGRDADYDTSADPVVRTTASEVRKRIAQYYQEVGHEKELRIDLPLGSYAAEFHLPGAEEPVPPIVPAETRPNETSDTTSTVTAPWDKRWLRLGIAGMAMAAVLAAAFAWFWEGRTSAIRQFWRSVSSSKSPALVCLNTWDISSLVHNSTSTLAGGLSQAGLDTTQWLPINDAVAFSQVTGFLGELQTNYRMQGARSTTLSDLMQGPAVLIGIFGNPWTQRLSDSLRFHFVHGDPGSGSYIADRKDASKRYAVEGGGTGKRDYAIVGRVFNPATGQVCFIIAGLDAAGTTAASEFVTSPRYMDYFKSVLPSMTSSKNVEAVISVEVIDGRPGAPHIEAAEAW